MICTCRVFSAVPDSSQRHGEEEEDTNGRSRTTVTSGTQHGTTWCYRETQEEMHLKGLFQVYFHWKLF